MLARLRCFDWVLLFSASLLTCLGILSMFSTMPSSTYQSQIMFLGLSIVSIFIVIQFDFKIIINYAYILFFIMLGITALTLVFGVTRNGATAWFSLGSITFQPSEVLKLTFILALTRFFVSETYNSVFRLIKSFLFFVLPILLVLYLQRDIGTAIVFLCIWFFIVISLSFSRFEWKRFILFLSIGIIGFVSLAFIFMQGYQASRIAVFPDHFFLRLNHHSDQGYQVDQSLIAIGSSNFWGKGLGKGTQNQFGFLPEKHNDFIYASIVEEMGIIGAMIIFSLFIVIVWRYIRASKVCEYVGIDIMIAGVLGIYTFHLIQNVGMNIGIVPVTGISLPFISYGGSFLLTNYLLLGMVESMLLRYKK